MPAKCFGTCCVATSERLCVSATANGSTGRGQNDPSRAKGVGKGIDAGKVSVTEVSTKDEGQPWWKM